MAKHSNGIEMFLVRVGDAERDACIQALTEHHIRGRLSVEEFDRRQRAALNAFSAADLGALVADLPLQIVSGGRGLRTSSRRGLNRSHRGKARTAAIVAGPPVVLVSTSLVMAGSLEYAGAPEIFFGSLLTGAVGFLSHWVVSRLRR